MRVQVLTGDILDMPADVLISSANPWLQMTGGVNLKIILSSGGEEIHEELQQFLRTTGARFVEPGTVVQTSPASLPVKHILHAVAINPSYDSSVELLVSTIGTALNMARDRHAKSVTLPALATGFGPLSMSEFATALKTVLIQDWDPIEVLKVMLLKEADRYTVRQILSSG